MLVLSRLKNESIMIGDTVIITVIEIRGDKVRLGITAPTEIPVHRQEVYKAIQQEKIQGEKSARANAPPALGDGGVGSEVPKAGVG